MDSCFARVAWVAIRERPLTGWGLENFRVPFSRHVEPKWFEFLYGEELADKPHNQVLEVGAESGVLGLLAYAMVAAAVIVSVANAMRRTNEVRRRCTLLAVATLWSAWFVHNLFLFDTPASSLMVAIALAVTDRLTAPNRDAPSRCPVPIRAAVAVPVAALAVGLTVYNVKVWIACAGGREAAHLETPHAVAAVMTNALAEDTYVAELVRRVAAGPTLDRLHQESAKDLDGFAAYVNFAVRELEAASRQDPLDPRLPSRLAELYLRLGGGRPQAISRAEAAFRAAIRLVPGNPNLYGGLAKVYRAAGRATEASEVEAAAARLKARGADAGR